MWYFLTYLNSIPRGYIALFYTCLGTRPKQIALSKSYSEFQLVDEQIGDR